MNSIVIAKFGRHHNESGLQINGLNQNALVPFARRRSTAELFSKDGRDWAEQRHRVMDGKPGYGWFTQHAQPMALSGVSMLLAMKKRSAQSRPETHCPSRQFTSIPANQCVKVPTRTGAVVEGRSHVAPVRGPAR